MESARDAVLLSGEDPYFVMIVVKSGLTGESPMHTQAVSHSVPLNQGFPLLQKLASDDAFRRELEERPAEALARFGLEVSPEDLPAEISLPSAAALQDLMERKAVSLVKPPAVAWHFGPRRA